MRGPSNNAGALTFFDAAHSALRQAASIDEVRSIRDRAVAIQAYLRQSRESLSMQNMAAEIRLRAEKKLGKLLYERVNHQGGRSSKRSHDATVSLRALGVSKSQSSRLQRVARIPDEAFERYIATTKDSREELTTAGLLRATTRQNVVETMASSESFEWYTPTRYIEAVRTVLGTIDLDPASSAEANGRVGAARYFTVEDDGLTKPWRGRVYLNPPYGLTPENKSSQAVWSSALAEHFGSGDITSAILLVNASTDASWFAALWEMPICFVDHRIRFERPGKLAFQPTHGNVFVYFGTKSERFASLFAQFGRLVFPSGGRSVAV